MHAPQPPERTPLGRRQFDAGTKFARASTFGYASSRSFGGGFACAVAAIGSIAATANAAARMRLMVFDSVPTPVDGNEREKNLASPLSLVYTPRGRRMQALLAVLAVASVASVAGASSS